MTSSSNNQDVDSSYNTIKILWRILYLTVLILSWIIIPIAQEYENAGDFEPKLKLKRSLKNNLIVVLIGLIALVVFVIYLVFIKKSFAM